MIEKKEKLKAGHYEIQGETIAKFEFFDHGFNPYSRYLDVDKIDLILRRRDGDKTHYAEVQVKYGRLYYCGPKWERKLFDVTSWKMLKPDEFSPARPNFFIAFVFVHPEGYKGDMFILSSADIVRLLKMAVPINTKKGKRVNLYFAHSRADGRWYMWRKRSFDQINDETTVDVTKVRRNFEILKKVS